MTPKPAAATEPAQRLWDHARAGANTPEEVALAAEAMCTQLRIGLGRWIGADGYRALFDRALGLARAAHPALGGLSGLGGSPPVAGSAVPAHSGEVSAGLVALVATLIELLGRIIGTEMGERLVEESIMPNSRDTVNTSSVGDQDG